MRIGGDFVGEGAEGEHGVLQNSFTLVAANAKRIGLILSS